MHFRQGKPCQDYALSGTFENISFAIVSDGCGSGENTDIGARFAALAAAAAIKNHWSINRSFINKNDPKEISLKQSIIQGDTYHMLGLSREDMLATCLLVYISPEGGFIHVLGDGVIAWKSKNGAIVMRRLDWLRNAPLYPIYGEDNFSSFIAFHGGDKETLALSVEEWRYEPTKGHEHIKKSEISIANAINGHTEFFSKERILEEEIEFIAIFSDGAAQIENMDWKNTIVELLAYKSMAGAFVKRRAISFLKSGKKPLDDLSVAAIRLSREEEE